MEENQLIAELYQKLDHDFLNSDLLKEALTHPSVNSKKMYKNYERLEFLGDSVLALVITEILIKEFVNENEGDLAKRRASLISRDVLHHVANNIGISSYIFLSVEERKSGGANNPNILADVLEAVIGAIYLDSGLESAKKLIAKYWLKIIKEQKTPPVDVKNSLQEWSQSSNLGAPQYEVVNKLGKDHQPLFISQVTVTGIPSFFGKGETRKQSEKQAAEMMLEYVKVNKL